MAQIKQKEIEKQKPSDSSRESVEDRGEQQTDPSRDQEFGRLREAYQNANFDRCNEIMDQLAERYPDHPILQKYREEIDIRQTLKTLSQDSEEIEKQKKKTRRLRLGLFAVTSTLLVFVVFVYSYFYFNIKVSAQQLQEESSILMRLDEQVEHLLLVGKPRTAAEVLEQMRAINASYERLYELETRTYDLLLLDEQYQHAMALIEEGQPEAALAVFIEIENKSPGLWDVRQQINALDKQN